MKIKEFVEHHNHWTRNFSEEQVEQMWKDDEVPGENLEYKLLHNKEKDEYWAYLGSYGGMSFSFDWKENYFPDIVMYDSTDFPYYNDQKNTGQNGKRALVNILRVLLEKRVYVEDFNHFSERKYD